MSGIQVSNATYGAGSTTVDVTASVGAAIKDGVLSIPAVTPTALNVTDPVPNSPKVLHISYTVNGGEMLTLDTPDNNSVYINAPPQRTGSGLKITKAEYGYTGNFTDVTDAIQNHIKNGGIDITVGYKVLGLPDPNPNKQKQLDVQYTINEAANTVSLNDGQRFKVSAPASDRRSNSTPFQDVSYLISSLVGAVLRYFAVYLHIMSVYAAMQTAQSPFMEKALGGVSFFIPFFSFWLLPMITFARRLFSSTDLV